MRKRIILIVMSFLFVLSVTGCENENVSQASNTKTAASYTCVARIEGNAQVVESKFSARAYKEITVQVGIPVKWEIEIDRYDLNGCNNEIMVREYGINEKLKAGTTLVQFTPSKTGVFPYSCWMGMIRSQIVVVDDLSKL